MTRLCGDDPPVEHFADTTGGSTSSLKTYGRDALSWEWTSCSKSAVGPAMTVMFYGQKIAAIGAEARFYRVTCREDEAWRRIKKRNRLKASW
jgi:hypothetical protein